MQGMHGGYSKTEEMLFVVVKLTGLLNPPTLWMCHHEIHP